MRSRDPEISVCFFGGGRVSFLSKNLIRLCVIICKVSNLLKISSNMLYRVSVMSWFQVFLYRHLYLGTRSILTHFFEMA